ncbi:hypothetical protein HMPREF1992_01606 [Selenomonas sp. oral taxon 892 str. F0426]|nr:hypothetical protein HMPREF1992_01606 [Selenomonas sp. oral taxon 892 str. F0426]
MTKGALVPCLTEYILEALIFSIYLIIDFFLKLYWKNEKIMI